MPTYCYTTDDGREVEEFFRMGNAPPNVILSDGSVAVRDFAAEHLPRRAGSGYPFDCYALGVHPSQIGNLRRTLDSKGCGTTDISRDGDPVIRGRAEYARVREALGVHQRNSFTSR